MKHVNINNISQNKTTQSFTQQKIKIFKNIYFKNQV